MSEYAPPVVDVAFDVAGSSLPADHAWSLLHAIEARLPWFAGEALAGVHPLRAVPASQGIVLLAKRVKLVLRMPASRSTDCLVLEGATLDVGGAILRIGAGSARALRPGGTLSAQRVATAAGDDAAFEVEVGRVLQRMGVECGFISGRGRRGQAGGREIAGFALALHGLRPADSLRIQSEGIGPDRRLGWGVFVPAKAIVAADE